MILKNCQILENLLGILRFPSPISRFSSPKIRFSSPKIRFSSHEIRFTQISFLLSLTLSTFFNGFLTFFKGFSISPTAFQISPTAFQFSSTAFRFPRNPRKSIYGEKYMKDRYSSFIFFATRSPSFVIPAIQYLRLTKQWTAYQYAQTLCICLIWMWGSSLSWLSASNMTS